MDAITEVLTAAGPDDLFAGLDEAALKKRYRKLMQQTHPDRFTEDRKAKATEAFNRLNELWDEHNGVSRRPSTSAFTFTTKKRTYVFGTALYSDTISTYYPAEYRDGHQPRTAMARFAKTPADNVLIDNYLKTVKKLNAEVPTEHQLFHPHVIDSARHRDPSSVERHVIFTEEVLNDGSVEAATSFHDLVTIADLRILHGIGFEARDMAWIFRRLLVALGTAHDAGLTHGGVAMDSIFIRAMDHGLILDGWEHSAELTEDDRIRDISAAAGIMTLLLKETHGVPKQITTFLAGCQLKKLPSAAKILAEFDDLLERLYGPRKFREFVLPREATKGH